MSSIQITDSEFFDGMSHILEFLPPEAAANFFQTCKTSSAFNNLYLSLMKTGFVGKDLEDFKEKYTAICRIAKEEFTNRKAPKYKTYKLLDPATAQLSQFKDYYLERTFLIFANAVAKKLEHPAFSNALAARQWMEQPSNQEEMLKIKNLDLSWKGMIALPPEIKYLRNLVFLNINVNPIVSLPKEMGELTNLKALFANSIRLHSLPQEVCDLNIPTLHFISYIESIA